MIYGGNGISPRRSSISSKIPSNSNLIILLPSSTMSIISPFKIPSPKLSFAPIRHFFPGFTSVSHVSDEIRLRSNISISAPVPTFSPYSLAGMTLELFTTRQSPLLKYFFIFLKLSCSMLPSFRLKCSSLEALLSSSGSCAISSGGRSYAKSLVFIQLTTLG